MAKDWLYYLAPRSIFSWDDLKRVFLEKFFLASRTTAIRKDISGIRKLSGESLYEYWKRFKKLCASCPHHQISEQLLLQYFYEGLSNMERSMIDAANNSIQEMMLLFLEESMRWPQIHLHRLKIKSLKENLMPWSN